MRIAGTLFVLWLLVALASPRYWAVAAPTVPSHTDDGLDPVNLIFTGYAPAWWVVQNFIAWSQPLCFEPKTLDGRTYDFTLETPSTEGRFPPCYGPRYHVRIWDMGVDPVWGRWSIGAVHHEHSECTPLCHHVIDGWENAEQEVRTTFSQSSVTVSITNMTLSNGRNYQNYYDDGVATVIQLSSPSTYPVIFSETGLRPGTQWSVTLNQTSLSSTSNDIVFSEPNGTYSFRITKTSEYDASPESGVLQVTGDLVSQRVSFRPLTYFVNFSESGLPQGVSWSVVLDETTKQSTNPTITFEVSSGSHVFRIQAPSGYSSNLVTGSLSVSKDTVVNITYESVDARQSRLAFFLVATVTSWATVGLAAALAFSRRRRVSPR